MPGYPAGATAPIDDGMNGVISKYFTQRFNFSCRFLTAVLVAMVM